ncbi:MAG: hypothetical protein ABNH38_04695 [Tateyamaria sp.]|uniref:hypothetical protein n=1 Tax=Tateyamaria sp. TaxID=1929288 RepID=UPI0032DBF939
MALERHRTDAIRGAGRACRINRPGSTYVRAVKNGIPVAVSYLSCHGNGFKRALRARLRGQKPIIHTLHPASMSMPKMALERAEKVVAWIQQAPQMSRPVPVSQALFSPWRIAVVALNFLK